MWWTKRRPEILDLFAQQIYGRTPAKDVPVAFHLDSVDRHALKGLAVRKQITMYFPDAPSGPKIHVLLYIPAARSRPVPVFLGLNFSRNQSVDADPGIEIHDIWVRDRSAESGYVRKRPAEESRGSNAKQWQVGTILSRGYALATLYYGDIEPDFNGGIGYGIRPLFFAPGQTKPAPDEWGALGAWAWGLSRTVDYLMKDDSINGKQIAVMGHSRLGKATLWAAAQDQRFDLVISNESGKGGASLSKRSFGETIEHLNDAFPHWFCANYRRYIDNPAALPVDGNMLLALIAPRPLYVASAEGDLNSDPRGEYLSSVDASRVYELLGKPGLDSTEMPPVDHPVFSTVAYHVRTGKHDVTAYDWQQYLKFADIQFHHARQQVATTE